MKNSKNQLKALNASIEHWRQNLDLLVLNKLTKLCLTDDIEINYESCPLCQINESSNCYDCLLFVVNGEACTNSVWGNVNDWMHYVLLDTLWTGQYTDPKSYNMGFSVISAMINYLILTKEKYESGDY